MAHPDFKLIRFSNNTGIIWKSTSPMIAPNPKDINFDNNSSEIALLFFDLPNNLLTIINKKNTGMLGKETTNTPKIIYFYLDSK